MRYVLILISAFMVFTFSGCSQSPVIEIQTVDRYVLIQSVAQVSNGHKMIPLDLHYKIVPSLEWLQEHTPPMPRYKRDTYDCDDIALDMMAANHSYAIGLVRIPWNKREDHAVNIVFMMGRGIVLYDAATKELVEIEPFKIITLWM